MLNKMEEYEIKLAAKCYIVTIKQIIVKERVNKNLNEKKLT